MNYQLSNKKHEKGQGLVEYSLTLVLVGIVVIASLMVLGPRIGCIFSNINSSLSGQAGGSCTGGTSSPSYTHSNYQSIPRMGSSYATEYFCANAGSGHPYNAWSVGSGWDITAGTDVPQSSINGGNATFLNSGTCP